MADFTKARDMSDGSILTAKDSTLTRDARPISEAY